jgi:hypothetical protein
MSMQEHGGSMYLEGAPNESLKKDFFSFAEKRTRLSSLEDKSLFIFYPHMVESPAGYLMSTSEDANSRKEVAVQVRINPELFIIDGEDYTDLIPFFRLHEYEEMWIYAKTGFSINIHQHESGGIAHKRALREQYKAAFKEGKAERNLEYMQKFLMTFPPVEEREQELRANWDAYEYARTRSGNFRDSHQK